MNPRTAHVKRDTLETQIEVKLDLDGSGRSDLDTGAPFLDHMLDQIARHGLFDLTVKASGDLHIDAHHTTEDVGITLGQAFAQAIGDKSGIRRYGHAYVPLDEALSRVVVDFSGRPGIEYQVEFPRAHIGEFDVDLFFEFFQGLVNHAGITLHIDNLRGRNAHHIAETIFKATGRALRMAAEPDPRVQGRLRMPHKPHVVVNQLLEDIIRQVVVHRADEIQEPILTPARPVLSLRHSRPQVPRPGGH